jgi:predicted kinase
MLVNVRGTHGSGKSTVVRTLLDHPSLSQRYGLLGPSKPEAYRLSLDCCSHDVFVLGPYHTNCGGCDALDYDIILDLIQKYEPHGHVVFEGALVSSAYGRVGELLERHGQRSTIVFLDTPLETCLRRIEARSGKPRHERLIKNVSAKLRAAERIRDRVQRDGLMRCYSVSDAAAPNLIRTLLVDNAAGVPSM